MQESGNISHVKKLSADGQEYYNKVASAWYKTTQGILETATTLLEAKENLSRPEWMHFKTVIEDNNLLSASAISKLIGIAKNKVFSNPEYQQFLPPSYATLYELKDQEEDVLIAKIKNKEITPSFQRKQIDDLFPKAPKEISTKENNISKITLNVDLDSLSDEGYNELVQVLKNLKSKGIVIGGIDINEDM